MLFFLFFACFVFLVNAQINNPTSSISSTTLVAATTLLTSSSSTLASTSTPTLISTLTSTTSTKTATPTTLLQGPVGQPAPTTGTPGGPTPYTYITVVNGVTQTLSDVFTPTSPATTPVTPSAVGTVLDYSSWLAIYGPTQKASAGGEYPLPSISSLIFVVLSGILTGGGVLIV